VPLAVNGRFVDRPITGVERYAREILARWDPAHFRIVAPGRPMAGPAGHLWEQIGLPARLGRGELLWSPANTGPIAVRTQVVTIHDASVLDCPEWFARSFAAYYSWLLPRLARRVARVITVSQFSRERLLERLSLAPDRVVAIAPGVSERFHPANAGRLDRVRHGIGLTPGRYGLAIGSIEPRKNLPALVRAWRAACGRLDPPPPLVICGASGRAFRAARLERAPDVQLIGRLADDELSVVYAGASVFVMPSLYEGFGLPVLEAMASGVPVICSSAGALPEAAGDAALLVDPRDEPALAEAIGRVLADEGLADRLRRAGLARAHAFSWTTTAHATLQTLLECLP
jgi:glycosyltransferase involved in cell wall biosynthesis